MTYSEFPICNLGAPNLEDVPCPPSLVTPRPVDLPIEIVMGTTTYLGRLRTDLPDRTNRVNQLVLGLWRRVNFINFNFSTTFEHTFKYPSIQPRDPVIADKKITGSAFDFQRKMLAGIDEKLDLMIAEMDAIRAVASIPEHWQIRPEAERPMAIFLFGEWEPGQETINNAKWQIAVPHADPSQLQSFDNRFGYRKGSYQCLYTMRDNSKIIFYGQSEASMQPILNRWLAIVSSDMKDGGFAKYGPIKGRQFSSKGLRLQRIDYYPRGILKSAPTMWKRFSRIPLPLN